MTQTSMAGWYWNRSSRFRR